MRCEVSRDNGATWQPLVVMRTAPGGPDQGQSDKSAAAKQAVPAAGLSVNLWTVTGGKTGYVGDLFVQLGAAATCDVSVTVGGVTVWTGQASQTPLQAGFRWPLVAPAGSQVQLVFGAPSTGTPAAYYRVGAWEQ